MTWSERARRGAPALVAFLLLGPPAGAADARAVPWKVGLSFTTEVRYDDNILGLSDREKQRLEDPALAGSGRFRIETPDDMILVPDLDLHFNRAPRRGTETDITLTLRAYEYARNGVKDYQQFGLGLRQELNRSRTHRTRMSLGLSRIPSYYQGELIDDNESQDQGRIVRNSLDYELTRASVEFSQELVDRMLAAAVGYAYERRDYNEHFNERDGPGDIATLELTVYPLRNIKFRVRPYFGLERRGGTGDLASTIVVDDDVSFDGDTLGLELRGLWGAGPDRRHKLRVWYEDEDRDYNTTFSPDSGHFGRHDDIRQYGVDYDKDLGPDWSFSASYRYRLNDSSLPSALGGRKTTPYEKNVVAAGLTYRFARRLDRPSHATKSGSRANEGGTP